MKPMSRTCLFMALSMIGATSFAAPPANSPYYTDGQFQYPQDKAQDVFENASSIACFINATAPQISVGVGQYLAYVDTNKCDNAGSSSASTNSSGATTVVPPDYAKALVTVTEGANGVLNFEVLISQTDLRDKVKIPKNIQVRGTIKNGANVTPPYGEWEVNYCSSLAGNAGSCDDGKGYTIVNGSGITILDTSPEWSGSGRSVFTAPGGVSGYGIAKTSSPRWTSENADVKFAFAPGVYSLKDNLSGSEACYNPSTSANGVRFSTWENYLYDKETGQKVVYDNGGFQLKSARTGYTVGDFSYWGVNFWNDADAQDQVEGVTLQRADNSSLNYTLKKAPGRLQRVVTSVSTGLGNLDGIPMNLHFGGWNEIERRSISNKEFLQSIGVNTSSNSLSLAGNWSASRGLFEITGYQDCSTGSCVLNSIDPIVAKTLNDLFLQGISDVSGWVNGVNVNYNFALSRWDNNKNARVQLAEVDIKLNRQSSEIVSPTDTLVPASLICVGGNCPAVVGGKLEDKRQANWPARDPEDVYPVAWNRAIGSITVSGGSVTLPVDWRDSGNENNGHYYQLYENTNGMSCDNNNGLCPEQVRNSGTSTYYTWQSGNKWDAYNYLVDGNGQAVQARKPLTLRYVVAATKGTAAGYVGKTISVESPRPGNLWLPGHCIDPTTQADAACNNGTRWLNDVVIPFAADDTGTVTLLNDAGQPTSTQYYVKWLRRGVFFERLLPAACNGTSSQLTQASQLELPSLSAYDTSTATVGLPWPTSLFEGTPRVIDGVLQ